jgi:hypothetical protein
VCCGTSFASHRTCGWRSRSRPHWPCYFFRDTDRPLCHKPELVSSVKISAAIIFCASIYEFQEQFLVGLNRFQTVSRVRGGMLFARFVSNVLIVADGDGRGGDPRGLRGGMASRHRGVLADAAQVSPGNRGPRRARPDSAPACSP